MDAGGVDSALQAFEQTCIEFEVLLSPLGWSSSHFLSCLISAQTGNTYTSCLYSIWFIRCRLLLELDSALQVPATRARAEAALLDFRQQQNPVPACQHILERSHCLQARFQVYQWRTLI